MDQGFGPSSGNFNPNFSRGIDGDWPRLSWLQVLPRTKMADFNRRTFRFCYRTFHGYSIDHEGKQMNQMSEGIVKPFAITAVAWLTLGSSLIYWLSETEIYSGVIWFFGIWITCIINLFLLGKTVASLLQMMSDTAQVKSVGNILRL